MSLSDELTAALLAVKPKVSAVRASDENEVERLRAQVVVLQRVVGVLAEIVTIAEGIDHELARKRLLNAARASDFDDDEHTSPDEPMIMTAYRGQTAGDGALRCSACATKIDPDDPQFTSDDGRRVCMACFRKAG